MAYEGNSINWVNRSARQRAAIRWRSQTLARAELAPRAKSLKQDAARAAEKETAREHTVTREHERATAAEKEPTVIKKEHRARSRRRERARSTRVFCLAVRVDDQRVPCRDALVCHDAGSLATMHTDAADDAVSGGQALLCATLSIALRYCARGATLNNDPPGGLLMAGHVVAALRLCTQ